MCSMKVNYLQTLTVVAVAFLAAGMPARASEIDDKTESSARNSYVFNTYLKGDEVKVESKEGVVTLSGTVNQESHKALAEETVANLPGVQSVDNRLELKGEHPAENSNEWTALKVKTVLLFHRNVNTVKTEVYVEEGVVTLRGEAASEAQRELITGYVKDVSGIEGVKNEMTVAAIPQAPEPTVPENIDDASITAQVRVALKFHHSIIVHDTKVQTTDGLVTLGGNVKDDTEKNLLTQLVGDIYGVRGVTNNMTHGNAIDGL